MDFQIPALKDLAIVKSSDGAHLIKFGEFRRFLDTNRLPSENRIFSGNTFRWLKCRDKYAKQVDGKPAFTIQSVIGYFLAHADQHQICHRVSNEIQRKIVHEESDTAAPLSSVKDVYNAVIKCKFLDRPLLSSLEIDKNKISTLHGDYKIEYSDQEWKKICFFEFHFMRSHGVNMATESNESILLKKIMFLETIQKQSKTADTLQAESKVEVVRRIKRKQIAEEGEGVCINGRHVHNAAILENDMCNFLQYFNAEGNLLCVDCTKSCVHKAGIHVYIEQQETDVSDIITCLTSCIEKSHKDACVEVLFVEPGTMKSYTDENGTKSRFQMRDDVSLGRLKGKTLHVWQNEEMDETVESDDVNKCEVCFGSNTLTPLSMESLDILTEWYLETPLVCQLILETFINQQSMARAANKEHFLTKKYTRLYSQYDALLNSLNKTHTGKVRQCQKRKLNHTPQKEQRRKFKPKATSTPRTSSATN